MLVQGERALEEESGLRTATCVARRASTLARLGARMSGAAAKLHGAAGAARAALRAWLVAQRLLVGKRAWAAAIALGAALLLARLAAAALGGRAAAAAPRPRPLDGVPAATAASDLGFADDPTGWTGATEPPLPLRARRAAPPAPRYAAALDRRGAPELSEWGFLG